MSESVEHAGPSEPWSADPTLRFDHLHVIESLPASDGFASRTGLRLVEDLEGAAAARRFQLSYHAIEDAAGLRRVLLAMVGEAESGRFPLVHLEAHGESRPPGKSATSRGMLLASGELFRWTDLSPYLAAVNRATRLRMMVFVATCFGSDIGTLWQPMQAAPARVMIGPKELISVAVLERGTQAFYRSLLATVDGRAALEAMNKVTGGAFRDFTAEWMFLRILEGYFNERTNPAQVAARVETTVVAPMLLQGAPSGAIDEARRKATAYLSDREIVFDECYRAFFCIDSHPDNADRFRLNFRACFEEHQAGDS